jgi:hypothetical protein
LEKDIELYEKYLSLFFPMPNEDKHENNQVKNINNLENQFFNKKIM